MGVVDAEVLELVDTFPMEGGRHPHGLVIAPEDATGYVACDGNDRLLTVDLRTDKVLSVASAGHDPDVLALDWALRRLYVASESGMLSTFDISDARAPVSLGDVFVAAGAHAVAVDPGSHRLFFALADLGGECALRILEPL